MRGVLVDSLSFLVLITGSMLVTLVAALCAYDYVFPVSEAKLGGIYPSGTLKRHA
jgi:hypothetical protein